MGATKRSNHLTVSLWSASHKWSPEPSTSAYINSVQSLSRVWLFAIPWTAARQASLSIINCQSLPKPMSIVSVMPSNHLILVVPFSSCPQSFPASGSFPMSQLSAWCGQNTGVSASTSVLPMNTQDWSPLGWTAWISLLDLKGLLESLLDSQESSLIP